MNSQGKTCQKCGRPITGTICPSCALQDAFDEGEAEGAAPAAPDGAVTTAAEAEADVGSGSGSSAGGERGEESVYGPYRAIKTLGEGGFGIVYLALQTAPIRRHVALKVLKRGMADSQRLLDRFELERQALARMDHPSICRVFDAGESAAGQPYFAMELVDGEAINTYCAKKHLPIGELLRLFRQVCSAVDHAHQRGVIHRDLKPSNIMITEREGKPHPVVIDFGIAKATEPLLASESALTLSFQIIGTPIYMSPEQAGSGGRDADVRSDVYSLGTILYELLAGRPPVTTEELRQIGFAAALRHICESDTPPPSTSARSTGSAEGPEPPLPPRKLKGDLDWITMRALAKDRERRYQSAREFADDLERYAQGMPVKAGPPSAIYRTRKFARRHPAAITAAAATIALGLVWALSREIAKSVELEALKARLLAAGQPAAPYIIAEIGSRLPRIAGELEAVARDPGAPTQQRINAALALAAEDPGTVPILCEIMLMGGEGAPDAGQAAAIQTSIALSPESVPAGIASRAIQLCNNPASAPETRMRAAALLAATLPEEPIWDQIAPAVARVACSGGIARAIRWAPAFHPVAGRIDAPVRQVFTGEAALPSGASAAQILAHFHAGDAGALAALAAEALPAQFQPLADGLVACGADAVPPLAAILAEPARDPASQIELDAAAERKARAAALMLRCAEPDPVRPLLERPGWGDPRLRTFIIHAFSEFEIAPAIPAALLREADSPSKTAALLLALGNYQPARVEDALQAEIVVAARSFLATAPEAEVHPAAEWLLRAWGERIDPLVPRSGPSPPPAAGAPGWETDPATGIAFATFAGPIEFQMGSPEAEPWRTDMEFLHRAEIPYSFAIATKTLTKNQAVSLLPDDFLHLMEGADSELPVREFTLFAARRLCNAASKTAGLPEDQWCYTAGAEPAPKENLESLGGYRFPTEAEWEYACRGGSSAPRPYGYSERLLPNYACISDYGGGMRPPGTKMPNGFGMFEMLGGVQNLVEGVFERYEGDPKPKLGKSLIAEILLPGEMAAPPSSALVRGPWETMPANLFRSAYRDRSIYPSKARLHLTSIRLARTIL